ncbi:hypothetical protein M3Y94_01277000 [Aphelenchoides besseyi]|nr:hypothetical protein M3Y94_01277000 [Aphelenchoides besseyi]KAI6222693.1 hypothetical protein M3Y95_00920700 [Aphelenchoides besseyi]
MDVDAQQLNQQGQMFPLTGTVTHEFFTHLFANHPEIADQCDKFGYSQVCGSPTFDMFAVRLLEHLSKLPSALLEKSKWPEVLSALKEDFGRMEIDLKDFNKVTDAYLITLKQFVSPLTLEQWKEVFTKADGDIKT